MLCNTITRKTQITRSDIILLKSKKQTDWNNVLQSENICRHSANAIVVTNTCKRVNVCVGLLEQVRLNKQHDHYFYVMK